MTTRYRYDEDNDGRFHAPDYRHRHRPRSGQMLYSQQHRRERSHERRSPSPIFIAPLPPRPVRFPPIIVNNRIINRFEDEYDDFDARFLAPLRPAHDARRFSAPVPAPILASPAHKIPIEWEIAQLERDLERQKLAEKEELREKSRKIQFDREVQKKADDAAAAEAAYERRLKNDLERKRREEEDANREFKRKLEEAMSKQEREAQEKKEKKKKADEKAIAEYKAREEEKEAAAKKAKEEFDTNYKAKLEKDLKRAGMSDGEIAKIIKQKDEERGVATYTKIALRDIEIETLNRHKVSWYYDPESRKYILVKRAVPQWELQIWWRHTAQLRKLCGHQRRLMEGKKEPKYDFQVVRRKRRA